MDFGEAVESGEVVKADGVAESGRSREGGRSRGVRTESWSRDEVEKFARSSGVRREAEVRRSCGQPTAARASRRAAREVMPSLGKIWYRCAPTVRCERNSRSAICLFVSPDAASWATSSSWGVRVL